MAIRNNILIINDDYEWSSAMKSRMGFSTFLNFTFVDNFADALELIENIAFFAIIYNAELEITNEESFVTETVQITEANQTKYLIYLGDLTFNDVAKFNYEFEPRAHVLSQTIKPETLSFTLNELIQNTSIKKNFSLDINLMNPFIRSTIQTLEMMCFVKNLSYLAPRVFDPSLKPKLDITGSLSMESDTFNGRLSICFNQETFLKLTGNMLGKKFTEIEPIIEDAAAELTNIIYGQTKKFLSELGYEFKKSFPKVILGTDNFLKLIGTNPSFAIPFHSDEGLFYIIVTIYI
jgi:chemotaxis protein CheX